MKPSISENNGISLLTQQHANVYSVGISTGGVAEMRMAKLHDRRQIIATTIDREGAQFAKQAIDTAGLAHQISVKVEDVTETLPYATGSFDFIYARLILHYLPKDSLQKALVEMYRILKNEGSLFVVVRSTDCVEAKNASSYNPNTGLTTYTFQNNAYSRHFQTEESIQTYLRSAGFLIEQIQCYEEQLCVDFKRTQLSPNMDVLIEVIATKSSNSN